MSTSTSTSTSPSMSTVAEIRAKYFDVHVQRKGCCTLGHNIDAVVLKTDMARRTTRNRHSGAIFEIKFHIRAGESGLSHHAADAGIIENGDDKLIDLDLHGEQRRLLVLGAAAALVRVRALERGHEGVGEDGLAGGRHGGLRQVVKGDVEAHLQRAALSTLGVLRVREHARLPQAAAGVREQHRHDVQGLHLRVAPPSRLRDRMLQDAECRRG